MRKIFDSKLFSGDKSERKVMESAIYHSETTPNIAKIVRLYRINTGGDKYSYYAILRDESTGIIIGNTDKNYKKHSKPRMPLAAILIPMFGEFSHSVDIRSYEGFNARVHYNTLTKVPLRAELIPEYISPMLISSPVITSASLFFGGKLMTDDGKLDSEVKAYLLSEGYSEKLIDKTFEYYVEVKDGKEVFPERIDVESISPTRDKHSVDIEKELKSGYGAITVPKELTALTPTERAPDTSEEKCRIFTATCLTGI